MLALLIYCYANGIFSSRQIERARHQDVGARFVAANTRPDHDTIEDFRKDYGSVIQKTCARFVTLCRELRLRSSAKRPVSHISSTLRHASRSSRRLEAIALRWL
jgi:transposase